MFAADPERFNRMWGKEEKERTPDGQDVYEPESREEFEAMVAEMKREGFA